MGNFFHLPIGFMSFWSRECSKFLSFKLNPSAPSICLSVTFCPKVTSVFSVSSVEDSSFTFARSSFVRAGVWITVSFDEHELSVNVLSSLQFTLSTHFSTSPSPSCTLLPILTLLQLRVKHPLLPPDKGLDPPLHKLPSLTWSMIRCAIPEIIIISAILYCSPGRPLPVTDDTGVFSLGFLGGNT